MLVAPSIFISRTALVTSRLVQSLVLANTPMPSSNRGSELFSFYYTSGIFTSTQSLSSNSNKRTDPLHRGSQSSFLSLRSHTRTERGGSLSGLSLPGSFYEPHSPLSPARDKHASSPFSSTERVEVIEIIQPSTSYHIERPETLQVVQVREDPQPSTSYAIESIETLEVTQIKEDTQSSNSSYARGIGASPEGSPCVYSPYSIHSDTTYHRSKEEEEKEEETPICNGISVAQQNPLLLAQLIRFFQYQQGPGANGGGNQGGQGNPEGPQING